MTYELITNRNMSEGMHVMFVYANDITRGLFMNLFVFAFFLVISMGLYYSTKKLTGNGDIPQAMAVGGFVTSIMTMLLRLIPGLVSGYTLTVIIVLTLIGGLWFLFSKD